MILRVHRFALDLPASPEEKKRIPLCRSGRFFRVDQGRFSVVLQQLRDMRRNAIERGVSIPLKLTHADDTAAIGWIDPASLTIEPAGKGAYILYGEATLTITPERLAELRAARAQYYISPEIVWQTHRMADSEAGPAGQPVGPSLVGAAAVLDPFFALPPVHFAALRRASRPMTAQRYAMDQMLAKIKELLAAAGIADDKVDGLAAQIALACVAPEETPAEEAAPAEPMPAENPAPASPAPFARVAAAFGLKDASEAAVIAAAASQSAQFSRAMERLAALEKKESEREKAADEALYAEYDRQGKLRLSTPEDARKVLAAGREAFVAAFSRVPALTEAPDAAEAPATLPTVGAEAEKPGVVNDALAQRALAYQREQAEKGKAVQYRDALKHVSRA